MNYYFIKLGLNSAQSEIISCLQNGGAEVIQTSDGLCTKTSKSLEETRRDLGALADSGEIEKINVANVLADENVAKDVKAFLS